MDGGGQQPTQDALAALVNQMMAEGADDDGEDDEESWEEVEDSPLIAAARAGQTSEVVALIAEGENVNQTHDDGGGESPLIIASEFGHAETVSVLCAAGAAVGQATSGGDTALLRASEEGHTETVSVLCAAGAAVDQGDNINRTPLFLAIDRGHLAVAQQLISRGASRAITVLEQERTALGRASKGGHAELAAWLTATQAWTTPLHYVSIIDAARVRGLLRSGASLHAGCCTGGPTPLDLAQAMHAAGDVTMDDDPAAALVLQAALPWSRETHALFPSAARARAAELLITGHRLSREPRFVEGAVALLDVWVGCVMPAAVMREDGDIY